MREFIADTGESYQFDPVDRLRGMYRNTDLDQAMEYANNVQQLLNTATMSPALAESLMVQLNHAWPYADQLLEVSGGVFTWSADRAEYVPHTLTDAPLKSEGFRVQKMDRIIDGRRQTINEVMLQFEDGVIMQRWNLDSTMVPSTVDIARHRLWYFHTDEAVRVQELLQDDDKVPSIMKLGNYCVDMLVLDQFHDMYKRDLEAYLTDSMQFDSTVPYQLRHYASPGEGELGQPEVWQSVVAPRSIELQPTDTSKTPCRHYPHLVASLFDRDPQVPNRDISVPLSSIVGLRSYRMDSDE